ncbi:MAG: MBL fold metallo-hydrolase [Marmoricola sp.]
MTRPRLGKPDVHGIGIGFDVPPAAGDLAVTFAGVSTLLFSDGRSAVLVDGFFSRPPLRTVAFGRLTPHAARIEAALERLGLRRRTPPTLEAVVPVHSHFDHAQDSADVARRTEALLIGGSSTSNLGLGAGLPSKRIRTVASGDQVSLGAFALDFVAGTHCPPDRYPGTIDAPVEPPARASAYRCGEAWSIRVTHASGRSALVQGSAGYVEGSLDGWRADVAYLGVGQLGHQSDAYIDEYWAQTVRLVGARRVVLTHWDNFFRPLSKPLVALPYAVDDLDRTARRLRRLAAEDGVSLHLPTVWRREDPWA